MKGSHKGCPYTGRAAIRGLDSRFREPLQDSAKLEDDRANPIRPQIQ